MIRVTFTATRELTGLHESGDSVTLEFSAQEPLVLGRDVSRDVQKAMNGGHEVLHHYGLRTWSVTTQPIAADTLDTMIEFLASVEGGETFLFEPWRYDTGPSLDLDFVTPRLRVAEQVSCILTSEGWSLNHLASESTGGADDWYSINFTASEEP